MAGSRQCVHTVRNSGPDARARHRSGQRERECEKRRSKCRRCAAADLQHPEEAVNRVLFSATTPNSAEWNRQRERYGRCVGRCRDNPSPQFPLQRVPGIRLWWRCPDACDFGNQVSDSGTGIRQLRRGLSRRQRNVQFRRQLHLQLNRRRGSLRELDEPVGPVLADQWEYISMESCDWPGFGSYQPDLDPERVRPISRLLSRIHRLLCDVRIGSLRNGSFCPGAVARAWLGPVVTHLPCEPHDVSGLGTHLRDPSSPHVCGESLKHQRRPQCERSSEQLRWFEPNDTPGPDRKYFLAIDCFDSVHCQPYCPW